MATALGEIEAKLGELRVSAEAAEVASATHRAAPGAAAGDGDPAATLVEDGGEDDTVESAGMESIGVGTTIVRFVKIEKRTT